MRQTPRSIAALARATHVSLVALGWAACLASPAMAATPREPTSPPARYQKEAGKCMALRQLDERATCLDAAFGRLLNAQPTPKEEHAGALQANALKRCEPLPEALRKDCVARMSGLGTQSGSVAEGGIYRELVTLEVGPRPAPLPAEPPASAPAQTRTTP